MRIHACRLKIMYVEYVKFIYTEMNKIRINICETKLLYLPDI